MIPSKESETGRLSSLAADLIEALSNSRVVDALGKALASLITLSVQKSLEKQLEGLSTAVRELKAENVRLFRQCEISAMENARQPAKAGWRP